MSSAQISTLAYHPFVQLAGTPNRAYFCIPLKATASRFKVVNSLSKVLTSLLDCKIELAIEGGQRLQLRRVGVCIAWTTTKRHDSDIYSVAITTDGSSRTNTLDRAGIDGLRVDIDWASDGEECHIAHLTAFATFNRTPQQLESINRLSETIWEAFIDIDYRFPDSEKSERSFLTVRGKQVPRIVLVVPQVPNSEIIKSLSEFVGGIQFRFGGFVECQMPDWMTAYFEADGFLPTTRTPWPRIDSATLVSSIGVDLPDIDNYDDAFALYLYPGSGERCFRFISAYTEAALAHLHKSGKQEASARPNYYKELKRVLQAEGGDGSLAYERCERIIFLFAEELKEGRVTSAEATITRAAKLALDATGKQEAADILASIIENLCLSRTRHLSELAAVIEASASLFSLTFLPDLHRQLCFTTIERHETLIPLKSLSEALPREASAVAPSSHSHTELCQQLESSQKALTSARLMLRERDEQIARQTRRINILEDRVANFLAAEQTTVRLTEWFRNIQVEGVEQDIETDAVASDACAASTLAELSEHVIASFEGKIVLTRAAIESMHDSPYIYINRAWRAFSILAGSMRESFLGRQSIEVGRKELRDEHMTLAWSQAPAAQKNPGWYRLYKGRKADMSMHICAGTSLDPRRCLRIHFEFDGEVVVVHHAGRHLDTGLI